MPLFAKALWFVSVLLFAGLVKLLFDNILYAAIMRYLGTYGIVEGDLVAVVATNLIPIVATISVVALIYGLSSQHHAAKTAGAVRPDAVAVPKQGIFKRILVSQGPLPAIALSLAVAFAVGIFWQINYGPLTQLRKPPVVGARQLTEAEKRDRLILIVTVSNSLDTLKLSATKARELSENWQYRMQTGASDFFNELVPVGNGFYLSKFNLKNSEANAERWPDMAAVTKADVPDCDGKTNAFIAEIKRINGQKGADLVFTLLNDTKLVEWRAVIPECEKWATVRAEALAKRRAELIAKDPP